MEPSTQATANIGENPQPESITPPNQSIKPTLQYLFLARDVLADATSHEISAIRIFDTIFLPKELDTYFYSFYIVGRLHLNSVGLIKSIIRVKLSYPSGKEVRTAELNGTFDATYGINFTPVFFLIPFNETGKYTISVSVNANDGEFVEIMSPQYFWAKKMPA